MTMDDGKRRNDPLEGVNGKACNRWLDAAPFADGAGLSPELLEHIEGCDECRREWREMREVWEALAMDADDIEVPAGLKEDVMSAVFDGERRAAERQRSKARLRRGWLMPAACAACLIAGAALGVFYVQHAEEAASKPAAVQQPMLRGQEWKLVSYDANMPQITGTAAVVRQGDSQRMVVDVTGLKPTTDDQAYQVWLLHDGERMNCGTFRVDERGKGTLVYYLYDSELDVSGIGITLEPDALGTAPRGKKVAGTPAASS